MRHTNRLKTASLTRWLLIMSLGAALVCNCARQAFADYAVSRGRQVLLNRGFQVQALTFTLPQDGFTNLNQWNSANFSTFNFWTRSDVNNVVFPQFSPGQQWAKVYQGDELFAQEVPYASSLTDLQWYDEVSDTMQRLPEIAAKFRSWNTSFPNALAHTNFFDLNQVGGTQAGLANFVQSTKPDIITFDHYPNFSFSNSQRNSWYSIMQTYRTTALAGYTTDAGTNSGPLPYGQFLNLYRDNYSAATPSESFVRLQQFASAAFGYTWTSAFVYNSPVGSPGAALCPVMFNSNGDSSPTAAFNYVAQSNHEIRNLGSELTHLVSTDIRMIPGKNGGVTNSLPSGISSWASGTSNTGAYQDYITSIQPTISQGGANDTSYADVLVGYFNPLLSNNSGLPSINGLNFMIVNGSASSTAAASAQWYRLTFNFAGSGFDSLSRINRDTGRAELVPLTHISGSTYSVDVNLPGGTGDLFGFWNSQNSLNPSKRVLIDQNFDDTNVFVAGTQLDFAGKGSSSTTAGLWRYGLSAPGGTVTGVQSYSGNQSIATVRTTFGPGQVLGYVDNNLGVTAGKVESSFRFERGTTTSAASFRLGYSGDIAAFANIDLGIDINSDGTASVINQGQPVQILSGIASGNWHALKVLLDINTKTYDVYYSADGSESGFNLVYANAAVSTIFSSGGSVNCMWMGPQFNGGTVYFDNANLTELLGTLGDLNDDGRVDAADIQSMMKALSNKDGFKTEQNWSESELLAAADINGDGKLTNSDLQSLLNYLKNGNGSTSVPEPTSSVLLILGIIATFASRFIPLQFLKRANRKRPFAY